MSVSVVVADDQDLVRSGLVGLIEAAADLTVVAEAANGVEAVRATAEHGPDVVVMDIRMPLMDGIEATQLITGRDRARVLVLTTFDLDEYVFDALRAGASGFLVKDAPPEQLCAAIRVVAAGEALLAPRATRRLIEYYTAGPSHPQEALPAAVTDRERDVLELLAAGCTNAEIAERLRIGTGTVKTHVSHLLIKLGARDRVQLVIQALRAGLSRTGERE